MGLTPSAVLLFGPCCARGSVEGGFNQPWSNKPDCFQLSSDNSTRRPILRKRMRENAPTEKCCEQEEHGTRAPIQHICSGKCENKPISWRAGGSPGDTVMEGVLRLVPAGSYLGPASLQNETCRSIPCAGAAIQMIKLNPTPRNSSEFIDLPTESLFDIFLVGYYYF